MADPSTERAPSPAASYPDGEAPGINANSPDADTQEPCEPATAQTADTNLDEKKHSEDMPESEEEESAEIVHHYLTYSTELPEPTSVCPTGEGQQPAPEAPNLKNYDSPFDWPETRKNMTIYLSCFITALTAFSAGSYSPGVGQMTEEWHVSSVAAFVGITTFTCGKPIPIPLLP
jgi:hypothetical protein